MRIIFPILILIGVIDYSDFINLNKTATFEIPDIEYSESDLRISVSEKGLYHLDDKLFSGYIISKHENGELAIKKCYYNGLLEGEWLTYFENGEIASKRPYHKGKKHGIHEGYYENGQQKFSYHFEHGLSQGTHLVWYENGQLAKELNYKDGYELGSQKVWRTDGKMRSNYVVRENGRRYGMIGLKRCKKLDSESGEIEPYKGKGQ